MEDAPPAPPGAPKPSPDPSVTPAEATPAEAPPKKRSRGAWVVLVVVVALFVVAVLTGLLSPTVVLDLAALWPIGLGLVALAVLVGLLGRRRGRALGPLVALALVAWVLISVGLHLTGWSALPSSAGDVVAEGPGDGPTRINVVTRGTVQVGLGSDPLYAVVPVRRGGPTTAPSVLEQVVGELSTVRVLEYPSAGWFRFAGWNVELSPDPLWTVSITSPDFSADLRQLEVAGVTVEGDGTVLLPAPTGRAVVQVSGEVRVEIPAGSPAQVIGAAETPIGWEITDRGARAPVEGDGWEIVVGEGAVVRVEES
ncbi:MAG TPA: hypothetical protein VHM94_09310 [Acidimicrobiia bacterium]|nr:hypothetical protein [Acidimicrobiia bacterium]